MGPNSVRLVFSKKGDLDTELGIHTEGEHYVIRAKQQSQGMSKITSKPPEARRQAWNILPHGPRKEPALLTT